MDNKENEACRKIECYKDSQEYLLKCRNAIEHIRDYVIDKIHMDEQDKQFITNPNAYIEKCGALNALHDIKEIIEERLKR